MMAKILKKPTLGENSNFVASEETPLPTILILTLIPTANPKPPDFGEVWRGRRGEVGVMTVPVQIWAMTLQRRVPWMKGWVTL